MRPLLLAIPLLLAAHVGHADLGLPSRTIVVRDFPRLRQDLLDTLKVNLPDGRVDILKFRGAEVVLAVDLDAKDFPTDMEKALQELRHHCDRVIRMTVPGMFLSKDSRLAIHHARPSGLAALGGHQGDELPSAPDPAGGSDAAALPHPSQASSDPTQSTSFVQELLGGPDQPAGKDAGEDALYRVTAKSTAPSNPTSPLKAHGLKAYLAQVSGSAPPAGAPPPPPPGIPTYRRTDRLRGQVSPETLQALEVYPAAPVPAETGSARAALREQQQKRILVDKLRRSDGVSQATLQQIQEFQQDGHMYGQSTATEAVRSIYRTIFDNRRNGVETVTLQQLVAGDDPTDKPVDTAPSDPSPETAGGEAGSGIHSGSSAKIEDGAAPAPMLSSAAPGRPHGSP